MKPCYLLAGVLLLILLAISSTASVPETATATKNISSVADLVSFVEEAVVYAQRVGKDEALKTFADPNGSFIRGESYIWAYDFSGVSLAHPIHPEFVGENRLSATDSQGFQMNLAMRDAALNGSGFVTYQYASPVTGIIGTKVSYVKRVDDTWWLGSGIYGENITIPDTVPSKVRETIQEIVDAAITYAGDVGKEQAIATFNDPAGEFTTNGSYVFAFDMNGTTLAMPFHPDKVGVNETNLTDRNGVSIGREKIRVAREGGGFWYYVFNNPDAGNQPELKVSYIRPVDEDWVVGTGMYLSGVKAEFPAEDRDALVAIVKKAVLFVKEKGKDEAIREFNKPNGSFSDPKMFIFAFDKNGTLLANPYLPGLVGHDRTDDQDPYGAYPPRQLITNAENGGGFAYFFFADPAAGYAIRLKLGYTELADDLVVGAGIFAEK